MPRRVLIVDDNADIAALTALLLQESGHEVRTAGDGRSALAEAAAQHPDVVFLDINLPGMDGFELARRLRAQATGPLTLVALSGYVDASTREKARKAGIDAVMEKQGDVDELERQLLEHL